jgi:predicted nucleic acid-binding protein
LTRLVTADTSVVVPAVLDWHDAHDVAAAAIVEVVRLPAHVLVEAYSVLTRLPHGLALAPADASALVCEAFPGPALVLDAAAHRALLEALAQAGVRGGAVYDALVGWTAAHASAELLTLDARAMATYRTLGVSARLPA